jgi:predicted nucleic acid-binding protein
VIAVDTSVWIATMRQPTGPVSTMLRLLLDADEVVLPLPVRIELLAGVARKDRKAFARGLSALPIARPTDDTWAQVEAWSARGSEAGQRFGITDLLIAALAQDVGGLVWSLDADFQRMEALGFVRLYS